MQKRISQDILDETINETKCFDSFSPKTGELPYLSYYFDLGALNDIAKKSRIILEKKTDDEIKKFTMRLLNHIRVFDNQIIYEKILEDCKCPNNVPTSSDGTYKSLSKAEQEKVDEIRRNSKIQKTQPRSYFIFLKSIYYENAEDERSPKKFYLTTTPHNLMQEKKFTYLQDNENRCILRIKGRLPKSLIKEAKTKNWQIIKPVKINNQRDLDLEEEIESSNSTISKNLILIISTYIHLNYWSYSETFACLALFYLGLLVNKYHNNKSRKEKISIGYILQECSYISQAQQAIDFAEQSLYTEIRSSSNPTEKSKIQFIEISKFSTTENIENLISKASPKAISINRLQVANYSKNSNYDELTQLAKNIYDELKPNEKNNKGKAAQIICQRFYKQAQNDDTFKNKLTRALSSFRIKLEERQGQLDDYPTNERPCTTIKNWLPKKKKAKKKKNT